MHWIEGLERTQNGFVLNTLTNNGIRTQDTLAGLGTKPIKAKTSRNRITTDCQSWSIASAQRFWECFAVDRFVPSDRHTVFKFVHDDTEYHVPANVVMAAMIRPIKHVHAYLFRPQGLEQMCIPLLDSAHPKVGFFSPQHRVTGGSRMITDGLLASYSWMHCFPSARAMWDSVYQAALAGRLDIALPKARITAILRSVAWNGVRLVTDLSITTLHVEEEPFDYASCHPRHIVFHECAALNWAYEHRAKEALPSRHGAWSLTDPEWHLLSSTMQKKPSFKHDLRNIIDLILIKLGTGTAWRKLDFGSLNFSIVLATYQRMQRDGRWAILKQALKSMR